MGKRKTTDENLTTKAAALYLLSRGLASYAEVAELTGRSRQVIRYWGIEHSNAREKHLAQLWKDARRHAG